MALTRDVQHDEWVRPVMTGYRMECCRCGLTHSMDFRVSDNGGIEMRGHPIKDEKDNGRAA